MARSRIPIAFAQWEQPPKHGAFRYGKPQQNITLTDSESALQVPHFRPRVTEDCFRKPVLKDPTLPIGPEHKAILIASEFHIRDIKRDNMRLKRWAANHHIASAVDVVKRGLDLTVTPRRARNK